MKNDSNRAILEGLSRSPVYQDYERAFNEATGLPLRLTPVEDMQLAHHHGRRENPFCALMAKQNKSCAACLRTQHELAETAREEAKTVTCFAGMSESAVPLRMGDNLLGYLRTGEVLQAPPTPQRYAALVKRLGALGLKTEGKEVREAYFKTRVFTPKHYDSVVHLLRIFAQHLSMLANQVVFRTEHAEVPSMTRAREFIAANHSEDLTLTMVAKAVHMSTFYFCKQFKKATSVSFTNYLSRVRIEKAKEMLLDPHTRISEVAFDCGFQSLTHFNRVFRKLMGESPTAYRSSLPSALTAAA
jgi:AraC-like DNA-binding protein